MFQEFDRLLERQIRAFVLRKVGEFEIEFDSGDGFLLRREPKQRVEHFLFRLGGEDFRIIRQGLTSASAV